MVASTSFAATLVVGLAGVVAATSGGWLSDVVGRKPVMIYPRIVFLLAIYPLFLLIVQGDNASALLWGTAGLSILGNLGSAAIYAALAEVLPREIRGRSFSVIYSSAITIFGGSTQSMLYFLIHTTNDPMMPAWYLTGFTALGVAGVLLIAETAPSRRKELAAAAA
jgi:MFS family permease